MPKEISKQFANVIHLLTVVLLVTATYYNYFEIRDGSFKVVAGVVAVMYSLLALVALFRQSAFKVNLAVLTISLVLTAYSMEVLTVAFLYFAPPFRSRADVAHNLGVSFDSRTKLEYLDSLRSLGIDAYPTVHASIYSQDDSLRLGCNSLYPLAGISRSLALLGNESGRFSFVVNDEHGFNNPAGSWSDGHADIVLIGDSFIQGAFVDNGKDVGSQLRTLGRKTMNLGISGSGPMIELARLKEYGAFLKPRIVLWLYFEGNDLNDLEKEMSCQVLWNYLRTDFHQGLMKMQAKVDSALRRYVDGEEVKYRDWLVEAARRNEVNSTSQLKLFHLRTLPQTVRTYDYDPYPDVPPQEPAKLDLFREVLAEADRSTARHSGCLYFVYLPSFSRYKDPSLDKINYLHRQDVLEILKDLGIPILDFHQVLKNHPDPTSLFPLRLSGHYTENGYRVLAEYLDAQLPK